MNNKRRDEIKNITLRINSIITHLESIKFDEEMYYDNIPDNLQSSERAEISEEAIENLDEALESLNICIDHLEDIY